MNNLSPSLSHVAWYESWEHDCVYIIRASGSPELEFLGCANQLRRFLHHVEHK